MLKKVLNAVTKADIENIIDIVESKYKDDYEWVPVGGNYSNLSTLQMLDKGENGVIERITNAIDAVLEKEYQINPDISLKNPRQTSEKYFGIKGGNLTNYQTKDIPSELRNLVEVRILESGQLGRPTIEIRDRGIGISTENFGKTILSLQGGNKLDKFYLAGTFGQGGSTAIPFSPYVLYVSKVDPHFDSSNRVAFTITKSVDDLGYKTPVYMYLVQKSTGNPFTIVDTDNEFDAGTSVKQIGMDINQYGRSSAIAPGDASILHFINKKLFNPILPINVIELRDKVAHEVISNNNNKRLSTGVNSRLNSSDKVLEKGELETNYSYGGKVKLSYWIINTVDDYKNFNDKATPVLYTINGQVQGVETSNLFNRINKPYLHGHLIVNVDCDYITEVKSRLFTSDRARFQDNSYSSELRDKVKYLLENDQELVRFNKYFKEKMLTDNKEDLSSILNKKIENKLKMFLSSGGIGKIKKEPEFVDPVNPPQPVDPPELFDFPTFLKITNKDPMEVELTKTVLLNYNSDANESFDLESNIQFYTPDESKLLFDGFKYYSQGHGIVMFKFSSEVKIGDSFELKMYLKDNEQNPDYTSTIHINVVQKKTEEVGDEKTKQTPPINTYEHFRDDQFFQQYFADDEDLPSIINMEEESIDIHINMENRNIRKLIENINRNDENTNACKIISQEYETQIAFYHLLIQMNQDKLSEDKRLDPEEQSNELKRAALLITSMINDNLQVYITEGDDRDEFTGNDSEV